jgi:hypothetical protein
MKKPVTPYVEYSFATKRITCQLKSSKFRLQIA